MLKVESFVTKKENSKPNYPYIGEYFRNEDLCTVVIFTSPKTGLCIHDDVEFLINQYRTDWVESNFIPSKNSFEISNAKE